MKKFTIPTDFGGVKYPFDVYVGDPSSHKHPLYYQQSWLNAERGGHIPDEVMASFQKLKELAVKNRVSFPELCVYALEAANKENEQENKKE